MARGDIVVGLDIGTTKICVVVGEATESGTDIIGVGDHPSRGLRKGVVVNIDNTVESIKKAVAEAEFMAGCEINTVFAGIAGGHVKSFNSTGVIAIKDREVKTVDIDRVVEAAKAVAIPMDREVIHILPQEFILDGQAGLKDPVGMSGVRLESKVHIITAAVTSAQNIIKCANKAGLDVSDIILQQLASSEAILTQDEKDMGVAILDIGGGTTDIAVFADGSLKYTSVLNLGGDHVTNDIVVGLRTPAHEAEKIKEKYGCALSSLITKDENIEVPGVGGRKSRQESRKFLTEIIELRMEEVLELAFRDLEKAGFGETLTAGVVITGGGSMLEGCVELAEKAFNMPARRGIPEKVGGLSDAVKHPKYATGVGLVQLGGGSSKRNQFRIRDEEIFDKVKARMREWFKGIKDYF
ncbi:MAG: cell division protein FtsA [Nitrospirae bacterium]|nr:cell division protein FtsA [Nitrospirota bacterium]